MCKLTKSWETKKDSYGFQNSIDIEVNYNPEDQTYSLEKVQSWNARKTIFTDLTDVFETVPEFNKIIDQINWSEVYAEEMAAKEENLIDIEND
jgi:hypothetical protein